jgi:hypothetical protein
MAKTTGPLFSLTASGTVGNTITYSNWKGRSYVRRRVIPLNPQTADMAAVRNAMRAVAVATANANVQTLKRTPPATVDKVAIALITPDGLAWNNFLAASMLGTNLDNYLAAQAHWAVHSADQAAWNGAAQALTPAMQPAPQVAAFGVAATPLSDGNVFWVYCWGLFVMGLMVQPTSAQPTYA